MKSNDLIERTAKFALDIVQQTESLPRSRVNDVLGRQLLRAGTSVGANYRSVRRAQSPAHMISKLSLVEEEADECCYWLELLTETRSLPPEMASPLMREASQLTAIMVASKKTFRAQIAVAKRRRSRFDVRIHEGES
ncbi:MAG: four helix bundle protein [Dehalococcoidia bacterium]